MSDCSQDMEFELVNCVTPGAFLQSPTSWDVTLLQHSTSKNKQTYINLFHLSRTILLNLKNQQKSDITLKVIPPPSSHYLYLQNVKN